MKNSKSTTLTVSALTRIQRRTMLLYLLGLLGLSASMALMPTSLLRWQFPSGMTFYGNGILFWLSVILIIICCVRFRKRSKLYQMQFPSKLSSIAFSFTRNTEAKYTAIAAVGALLTFIITFCFATERQLRFTIFAVFLYLLGLYLWVNSTAYQTSRKYLYRSYSRRRTPPSMSQARRDET